MIKKQFLKSKPVCKATFTVPTEAKSVAIVGEFNDWNTEEPIQLTKQKDHFKTTLSLETGKEYQFRYLIDGQWANEVEADRFVTTPFGSENSVISTLN
jgi:1,4-alpha-glucan branching enzyme